MRCERCHFEVRKNGECFCNTSGVPEFINDIPEHFNRGLGMVIKSRRHYNAELKERNLIEVGNEKKYISKEYEEKQRARIEDQQYKQLRPEAYRMLSHLENKGVPEWN